MLYNYLRVALRSLQRSVSHSIINVLGLTLGISCSILIYLLVAYHLNFDTFHGHADRIYRFVTEQHRDQVSYTAHVPPAFGNAFRNDYTYGELVARLCSHEDAVVSVDLKGETKKFNDLVSFADPEYFSIFNFPVAEGVALSATPHTAVITRRMAAKYFGTISPLGQTLRLDNRMEFQITGVLFDIPDNTDFRTEIFLSYSTVKEYNEWYASDDSWGGITSDIQTFARLRPGTDPLEVEKVLPEYVRKYRANSKNVHHYKLQPLRDIHFNALYSGQISMRTIWILAAIGFLLIFTACLNFINLSTARAATRAKEVGVRKVLGSARKQLFWQFTLETFMMVMLSLSIAFGIASALLPSLNTVFNLRIPTALISNTWLMIFLAGLTICVTFLAGAYPGVVLSGFTPAVALKGKLTSAGSRGVNLRRSLIVVQFTISQVLLIGLIVVTYQMRFNQQTDMGFTQEGIVMVPSGAQDKRNTLKNELLKIPGVERVSLCFAPPASYVNWGMSIKFDNRSESEDFEVSFRGADVDYLSAFDIDLVAGRNVTPSDTVREFVVNEEFCRRLDLSPEEVLGKAVLFNGEKTGPIVGVVSDFHTRSFHSAIGAVMMTTSIGSYNDAAIRINMNDIAGTLAAIEKTWSSVNPDQIFSHRFVKDQTAQFYESEQMTLRLVKVFSFIALFIGCMGLYGLVSFMSVQKMKEIGIRKALGASVQQILGIFGKEFALLTLLSFMIAAPAGAWLMDKWLEQYAFKVNLTFWIFAAELGFVLLIVLVTTSVQSVKAALMNPVTALRTE